MSTYFLAVRFPLEVLGNAPPDRTAPSAPEHEQDSHVFFLTDLRAIADRLVDLFRQEEPDAAWQRAAYKQASRSGPNPLSPPIFEVVDGADHGPTECVRFHQEVRQLAEIAPSSFLDPDGWELLGFPNDPRTVLLVRHYDQARKWESFLRKELPSVSRPRARRPVWPRRNVKSEAAAPAVGERVWIWALRPLERDHTPNMCCSIDESPGCVVQMVHSERTGAAIPAGLMPDGTPVNRKPLAPTLAELRDGKTPDSGWCVWHRYYRPSDDDLSILAAVYPGSDPNNPNWLNVKRDLVCGGHAPDSLAKMEGPVLLGLLAEARRMTVAARTRRGKGGPASRTRTPKPRGGGLGKSQEKAMNRPNRRSLSRADEAELLAKCRRRCCVCLALDHDASEKKGQLAHLDHDRSNNEIDNFVYLCQLHHDTYDSKTSQTKNLTEDEVRLYRQKLHDAVARGEVPLRQAPAILRFPAGRAGPLSVSGDNNVVAGGDVNYTVNMPRPKRGKGRSATRPPIIPGTVSEDARMVGYLNYLVRRYEKFKKWDCDRSGTRMGYGVIRNAYEDELHYKVIHTPVSLFEQGARFLQQRIENTRLGRMKRGQKLYSQFDDFDERTSNDEGIPG